MQVELFDKVYCLKDEFKFLRRRGYCPSCLKEVKMFSVPGFYGNFSRVNFCCECHGIALKPCRFGLNAPSTTFVSITYSNGITELTGKAFPSEMHNVPLKVSHTCKVTGGQVQMTRYIKAKLLSTEMSVKADIFECPMCLQERLVKYKFR